MSSQRPSTSSIESAGTENTYSSSESALGDRPREIRNGQPTQHDRDFLLSQYKFYAWLGHRLAATNNTIVDLSKIAPRISVWGIAFLGLSTILEALGGLLLSLAAQVHVSPIGPLALPNAPKTGVLILLAVLGGLCFGSRQFTRIIFRLWDYIIESREQGPAIFRQGEMRQLSGYSWIVAHQFADSDREMIQIIVSIVINLVFGNIITWDGYAALSSCILTALGVAFSILAYWRTSVGIASSAVQLEYDLADIDEDLDPAPAITTPADIINNRADYKGKLIEKRFAMRNPCWELLCMISAGATSVVPIAVALIHKDNQLTEDAFADYLQANMVAAIVNFMILGRNLDILAEWVANRARLTAINNAVLTTQQPNSYPLTARDLKRKNTPVELSEAQMKECHNLVRTMLQPYQATVEDVPDDESIKRRRLQRRNSAPDSRPNRHLFLEYTTNEEEDKC